MEFTSPTCSPAAFKAHCKFPAIADMEPRGGATINMINEKLIIFGGADRQQEHFNDLWVLHDGAKKWKMLHCKGDVPMTRSGHSTVCYGGRYLLLFGGIDFKEEVVYNDLYALDLDTWEWTYIGEAGEEVAGRNSHASGILRDAVSGDDYLVVYGGASPEHGPLGDTYAAKLPRLETIGDVKEMYVTWSKVEGSAEGTHPGKREMQAGCVCDGAMYITGGRSIDGQVLSDTWKLSFATSSSASTSASISAAAVSSEEVKTDVVAHESTAQAAVSDAVRASEPASTPIVVDITKNFGRHVEGDVHDEPITQSVGVPLVAGDDGAANDALKCLRWECCRDLILIDPLCSHVAAATADGHLILYGGFTGTGISDSLQYVNVRSTGEERAWHHGNSLKGLEPRFGASVCTAPSAWVPGRGCGIVLFGGVNAENDFSDVWLFKE